MVPGPFGLWSSVRGARTLNLKPLRFKASGANFENVLDRQTLTPKSENHSLEALSSKVLIPET